MDILAILVSLLAVVVAVWAEIGVRRERRRSDQFRNEYEKRLSELQIRQPDQRERHYHINNEYKSDLNRTIRQRKNKKFKT